MTTSERTYILDIPFEMRAAAKPLGATWDPKMRAWTCPQSKMNPALRTFMSDDYSWERWQEDEHNNHVLPVTPNNYKMKPRPHQLEAAKKIAIAAKEGYPGFLEADDVGLGKTISVLVGAYGVAKLRGHTPQRPAKVLIVCPKAVIPHWRNVLKSLSLTNLRAVVINYDRLKSLLSVPETATQAKRTRTKNKRIASQGKPLVDWDIIIADESHKMKNDSQRTHAFERIAGFTEKNPNTFVIWASATAGQHPLEIGYLAPLIGHLYKEKGLTTKTWGEFLSRKGFNVKKGKVAWAWVKADPTKPDYAECRSKQKRDIKLIRDILFSADAPSIRRLPTQIAGWPEVQRIPFPLSLDTKAQTLYDDLWTNFRSFLRLNPRGKDPRGGLAAQLRFRQKASLLRVPETISHVLDLLDNGLQVAISVEFMETLDTIRSGLEKKGYACAEFSGRNTAERESERLKFQKGQVSVILFTVEEGISLHAEEQLSDGTKASSADRAMVIHDVRYSSLANLQIIGRTHRDGKNANAYFMYAQKTVEEKIIKVMLDRMANTKEMAGDALASVQEIEDLLQDLADDESD